MTIWNWKSNIQVIKQAYAAHLIVDGALWIEMLDKRDELAHSYNDDQAQQALHLIRNIYFRLLQQVYLTLLKLNNK